MLILHAPNIHTGGGKTLLLPILAALPEGSRVHMDSRLDLAGVSLPDGIEIVRVAPTIRDRLSVERQLSKCATPEDTVLCFGNLPPLLRCRAKVHVLVQNRYLITDAPLDQFGLKTRARLFAERLWLHKLRRESALIVQTETMALLARKHLGACARALPFKAPLPDAVSTPSEMFDYIYVASAEPHKNHDKLLDAWELLANELPSPPSLALTTDLSINPGLAEKARRLAPLVKVLDPVQPRELRKLYQGSRALIYPSLFESFGLPLMEASEVGLPIIAAERDYVRDVCVPTETFDPNSARSIARAVARHQGSDLGRQPLLTPNEFLTRLVESA